VRLDLKDVFSATFVRDRRIVRQSYRYETKSHAGAGWDCTVVYADDAEARKEFKRLIDSAIDAGAFVQERLDMLLAPLRIAGIEPLPDEDWDAYNLRCRGLRRKQKQQALRRVAGKNEHELLDFIKGHFQRCGLGGIVRGYQDDMVALFQDYFPDSTDVSVVANHLAAHSI